MQTLKSSVEPHAGSAPTHLDTSSLWSPAFPTTDLLEAAGALLTPLPASWRATAGSDRSGAGTGRVGRSYATVEGRRPRLRIGGGVVTISRRDPAKAERTLDRAREAAWKGAQVAAADVVGEDGRGLLEHWLTDNDGVLEQAAVLADGGLVDWSEVGRIGEWSDHLEARIRRRDRDPADAPDLPPSRVVTKWSGKSRTNMMKALAELEYAPLTDLGLPAMVTLTYPGDWLDVAPDAAAARRHLLNLRKRFERAWKVPLVALWKREFQARGAPHFHLFMAPPTGRVKVGGELIDFREWLARTWVDVVGHPDPVVRSAMLAVARHRSTVDVAEGMRSSDPKRLSMYFAKHGSFSAKDYQNQAPAEWLLEGKSIGRFWGYWGLERTVVEVEVSEVEADAAARTIRRWTRANGYRVQRRRLMVDQRTGELRAGRRSGSWVSRMPGSSGFVLVNDGPAFVGLLAPYLDQVRERARLVEAARLGFTGDDGTPVPRRMTFARASVVQAEAVQAAALEVAGGSSVDSSQLVA